MRKETEHYSSPNKADSLALAFYLQDETMQRKIKRKDMYETKRYNQSVSYTWMSA